MNETDTTPEATTAETPASLAHFPPFLHRPRCEMPSLNCVGLPR